MRVDLDKNLDKYVLNIIKTAMGYPLKSVFGKISYVNLCKLAQITKKNDTFGQIVPLFDIKLK